jgi:ferredoxin
MNPLRSVAKTCFNKYNFTRVAKMATVFENTIKITFVDREGNRATVPARIGRTILDTAVLHGVDLEGTCHGGGAPVEVRRTENWVEETFGEGPTCFWCHVQIPSIFHHLLPEVTDHERRGLRQVWEEEANLASRLGCMITLEKKHDGMVVFVPDMPPTNII